MDRYYVLDTGNIRSRNTYTREETVLGTWTIHEMYLASDVDTELAKKDEEIARLNGELEDYKEGTEGLKMAVGDLRDERDKYQEEIARLIQAYNKAVDPLEQDVKRLREEIARLRKALEKIWVKYSAQITFEEKDFDACIEIAREALER